MSKRAVILQDWCPFTMAFMAERNPYLEAWASFFLALAPSKQQLHAQGQAPGDHHT